MEVRADTFFRDLTENALRRSVFTSVGNLIEAIDAYLIAHNESPKPFIWTASAKDILAKVMRARETLTARIATLQAESDNRAAISGGVHELATEHPIDLCRYQVLNCYAGRAGLINSGGASGDSDFAEAARTAGINKRAGGMGLVSGRKAFQRPMAEGVKLLHTIQDVYLSRDVMIA